MPVGLALIVVFVVMVLGRLAYQGVAPWAAQHQGELWLFSILLGLAVVGWVVWRKAGSWIVEEIDYRLRLAELRRQSAEAHQEIRQLYGQAVRQMQQITPPEE